MVSSETGGVVDCGVGSIVWVRRRNGSWWPGKILGPEELSSTHITSPRSGTPVKLLGREDASVDWYNLEKSKRVKAFRCGQFDDSIEKAEATQGMPPKKREKYARREDAILHALELERQLLGKSYGPSNGTLRNSPEAVTSSGYFEHGAGNQKNLRTEGCDRLARSLIEKNVSDQHQHAERIREVNPQSGDDDSQGVLPRMRGLQDFGLRTVPPPREELSGVAFRAKRSRYDLPYDSGDSSNDNRLQLSLIEVPVSKHEESGSLANVGEDHISGSTEDTETDCSETDSLDSDSDDEMDALSDGSASIELQPKYPRTDRHKEEGSSSSSDDVDEFTDDAFHPYSNDFPSTSTGVSKWQLKRKRNTRSLGNRSLNRTDPEVSRRNSNWSSSYLNADLSDKSPRNHIPRYGSKALHGSGNDINDFPGFTWNNNHSAMREYWEPSREFADPLFSGKQHFGGSGMLVEVDLKVQASNYRRDVPLISLISKLNGHAIVGHPIQVEPVENGSTEHLFAATDYIFHESLESPNSLPQAWRTGRRTANFRVPRPQFVEPEKKLSLGSEYGNSGPKANLAKKSYFQYPVDGSFSRSSPKKGSLSSNQKIRTLSSIASEPKHQGDLRIGGGNYQVEGLIKTESVPTTVACIPVNLVFSRLNEELAGHK